MTAVVTVIVMATVTAMAMTTVMIVVMVMVMVAATVDKKQPKTLKEQQVMAWGRVACLCGAFCGCTFTHHHRA